MEPNWDSKNWKIIVKTKKKQMKTKIYDAGMTNFGERSWKLLNILYKLRGCLIPIEVMLTKIILQELLPTAEQKIHKWKYPPVRLKIFIPGLIY